MKGREFYKMSGSGNDFVFVDARETPPGELSRADVVRALCARGEGVGADGVVFLLPSEEATYRIEYLNADGSVAALCGNATLCATRLVVELAAADPSGFTLETGSGVLPARIRGGRPEIDLQPVTDVRQDAGIALEAGERRMGFALAGVPHLTMQVERLASVDVTGRGAPLRRHPSLRQGANVNFVARREDGAWDIRTYERGVEAETLACGTGAVASAILLTGWGEASGDVRLVTRSGRMLEVRLRREGGSWLPSLSGAARIVFTGRLGEIDVAVMAEETTVSSSLVGEVVRG